MAHITATYAFSIDTILYAKVTAATGPGAQLRARRATSQWRKPPDIVETTKTGCRVVKAARHPQFCVTSPNRYPNHRCQVHAAQFDGPSVFHRCNRRS